MWSVGLAVVMTLLALFAGTSAPRSALDLLGAGAGAAAVLGARRWLGARTSTDPFGPSLGALAGLAFVEHLLGYRPLLAAGGWTAGLPFLAAELFMVGAVFLAVLLRWLETRQAFVLRTDRPAEAATIGVAALSAGVLGYHLGLRLWPLG